MSISINFKQNPQKDDICREKTQKVNPCRGDNFKTKPRGKEMRSNLRPSYSPSIEYNYPGGCKDELFDLREDEENWKYDNEP